MKTISFQTDILPLKNLLFRLALRLTLNREDAEDVVQETLIKCWNKRNSWHEIDSIEAYATTVCRNLSLDINKRAGRRNRETTLGDKSDSQETGYLQPDTAPTPLQRVINQDRMAQLKQIIDELPEKQKLCMQLRDFEEKSYQEIAALLQIPEQQVKINIFRARQKVRQKFID